LIISHVIFTIWLGPHVYHIRADIELEINFWVFLLKFWHCFLKSRLSHIAPLNS
jgi:hypothetical protein